VSTVTAAGVIWRSQLSRIRVARGPLLIVASMQSIGLLLLLRGVVDNGHSTREQVVAGASVLVLAYVALNLLAQRFGNLKASGGLSYYAALPVSGVAVVLGTAAAYAGFTIPGAVLTGVIGCLLYGLPILHLWALLPVIAFGGAALAGLGACVGLIAPRAELATMLGQLGMSGVLFLGLIPEARMPGWMDPILSIVPSTYAVRALGDALARHFEPGKFFLDLAVCAAVAVASLAVASRVYDRVVRR
jgi:ABC-2 type transport system permease protein